MNPFLASALRILAIVAAVLAVAVGGLAWYFRQPVFTSVTLPKAARADAATLQAHVRFLTSSEHPRDVEHPEGLERAAGYILDAFRKTHAACTEQAFTAGDLPTKNIVARFGPAEGPLTVIGAHYDACGPFPGADDNASGVAGLIELARLLDGRTLAHPVELVAYSTEEPPYFGSSWMGSAIHAKALRDSGAPVRVMIGLEMIGYFTPKQPAKAGLVSYLYPRDGHFTLIAGRWPDRDVVRRAKRYFAGASDMPVVSYNGPTFVGTDLSDHRNYWAAGMSAMMVTDTADVRNPNYHRKTDTAETLDYVRLAAVVDGVLGAAVGFANEK